MLTIGSEQQGQIENSDPDQNRGFTCIFSSGMQESSLLFSVHIQDTEDHRWKLIQRQSKI